MYRTAVCKGPWVGESKLTLLFFSRLAFSWFSAVITGVRAILPQQLLHMRQTRPSHPASELYPGTCQAGHWYISCSVPSWVPCQGIQVPLKERLPASEAESVLLATTDSYTHNFVLKTRGPLPGSTDKFRSSKHTAQ